MDPEDPSSILIYNTEDGVAFASVTLIIDEIGTTIRITRSIGTSKTTFSIPKNNSEVVSSGSNIINNGVDSQVIPEFTNISKNDFPQKREERYVPEDFSYKQPEYISKTLVYNVLMENVKKANIYYENARNDLINTRIPINPNDEDVIDSIWSIGIDPNDGIDGSVLLTAENIMENSIKPLGWDYEEYFLFPLDENGITRLPYTSIETPDEDIGCIQDFNDLDKSSSIPRDVSERMLRKRDKWEMLKLLFLYLLIFIIRFAQKIFSFLKFPPIKWLVNALIRWLNKYIKKILAKISRVESNKYSNIVVSDQTYPVYLDVGVSIFQLNTNLHTKYIVPNELDVPGENVTLRLNMNTDTINNGSLFFRERADLLLVGNGNFAELLMSNNHNGLVKALQAKLGISNDGDQYAISEQAKLEIVTKIVESITDLRDNTNFDVSYIEPFSYILIKDVNIADIFQSFKNNVIDGINGAKINVSNRQLFDAGIYDETYDQNGSTDVFSDEFITILQENPAINPLYIDRKYASLFRETNKIIYITSNTSVFDWDIKPTIYGAKKYVSPACKIAAKNIIEVCNSNKNIKLKYTRYVANRMNLHLQCATAMKKYNTGNSSYDIEIERELSKTEIGARTLKFGRELDNEN